MEEDVVSALLGSSLQKDAFSCHQGTHLERNQNGAMQLDPSVASGYGDRNSKNVLKAVKLKIIATDELIQKFLELKQRHEKVYRLYKYQEKLIADLEETNRDHVKDKDLLREKLAGEKAGNQGFENTIAQFVARLEEAEQKMVVAQTRAKEAEETVTQLKKELCDKSKKIERLEKRLDSAKLLGTPCRARSCGKGGRQRKLSTADSGIPEGQVPSQPVAAMPVGASSEEAEDGDGFVDVLDEVAMTNTPPAGQRDTTTTTTDIEPHLTDTSEERHHPVCLPELDGVTLADGSLREHTVASTSDQKGKKGRQRRRQSVKRAIEPQVEEVDANNHDNVPADVTHTPDGLFDMPMLAAGRPNQSSSSTPASPTLNQGTHTPRSLCFKESSTPPAPLGSGGSPDLVNVLTKDDDCKSVPKGAVRQKRSRKLTFRTHRMSLRNSTLMADLQLSDRRSDEESETPVEGSGSAPNGDLPLQQEEVRVCGSDSEGDVDSGVATGSAAPSVVSEGGPSPSVAECNNGMEMETDECHRVVQLHSPLECNRDDYRSEDPIPTDYEDSQQSDSCDGDMVLEKRSATSAAAFEQMTSVALSHPPPSPHDRLTCYSLQEIFASMVPSGRLSPIPPDPLPSEPESKEEAGKANVSLPCPAESDKKDATGPPSNLCKDSSTHLPWNSCSSIHRAQDDSASKQSGLFPSVTLCSPKTCVSRDISSMQPRHAAKKDSVPSPLLSRQSVPEQCASPPAKHLSAVPVFTVKQSATKLSTRDILLSSCNRGSPSQHSQLSSLKPRPGRGRCKGKAAVGRTVVPKGVAASCVKGSTEPPPAEKEQPLSECEVEHSTATAEKCRDEEGSTVMVSLLQSGGGRSDLLESGGGRSDLPESGGGRGGLPESGGGRGGLPESGGGRGGLPESGGGRGGLPESGGGRGGLPESGGGRGGLPESGGGRGGLPESGGGRGGLPESGGLEATLGLGTAVELLSSAPEHLRVEENGKGLLPTSSDTSTLAATPSSTAAGGPACSELGSTNNEQGLTHAMSTSAAASTERGTDKVSFNEDSSACPNGVEVISMSEPSGCSKMADEEEEEMEDGELGSSDEEGPSPPCDQVCAPCVSLDQAVGEEGGSKGPPPQAVEGIGSKRGTPPQSPEACTALPAKKQKLSGSPTETFVVVAWLDPLVPKDSASSGRAGSMKKGAGVRRGRGQKEPNYVQSTLQAMEKGEVGVHRVFSLLAREENVKSRKKLIDGFQMCLYHYKPSWAKLQQKLKTKLDTVSSLTIGKTKDTRPLTPHEDPSSTEFLPCLLPFEAKLIWLVLQLSCYYGNHAQMGGANGQKGLYLVEFKEMLYDMIKKESKRFHLKCALIRLYVSCCRLLQGTREHVQLLSCELLSSCEPLMERRLPMIQSIACVWPLALTKTKDHTAMLKNGRYIPSVLEQQMLTHVPELVVVHTFWKDNPGLFTNMVFKSLFLLCHWRQNTPDSLKAVALGLVGVLHCSSNVTMVTPPSQGQWVRPQLSITGTRTINLLHLACRAIGWKWTSDVLIRTQLWPLLQSLNKKDGSVLREATLVGICTFFGMIRPLGVEYDSVVGAGSNCLQMLQKVLVSLLVKATAEQDREVSLAVQLTIADSLLALCPPGNAMATEAGSALTAWLQHNAKKHSWFAATVGQQYCFTVQQIASSQHQFVQFNEPTY